LEEITALTEAMPARLALAVPLASFCALRFGEMSELRRKDINLQAGVLQIRRGVVRVGREGYVVGEPKSAAGIRDVAFPPHLIPMIATHLRDHVGPAREALIFTSPSGGRLGASVLQRRWCSARDKVGRPDLRWHDLRHTGAVLAAQTGATVVELMGRLGHSTPQAAMIYQHAAQGRDTQIASGLSEMVTRAGT
jgi:integrase